MQKQNSAWENHGPSWPQPSPTRETLIVSGRGLRKLNVRPPLREYVRQLWDRRFFVAADARFRAFRTAKSYYLWRFWLIAQPMLEAAMYGLIFGIVLKTSRGVENFVGFLVLGVTFFGLMTSLINGGQSLIQTSKNLMQAFSFPRAALVLSQSLRYLMDNLPALFIAVVFSQLTQWEQAVSWTVLLVIPLTVLMWIFGTGLMFVVARCTAFIPDLKVLINLGVRAWFFGSGVFFSIDRFVETPELYRIFSVNPGYIFLTAVRQCAIYSEVPSLNVWISLSAWSLATFAVGFVFFWRAEERYVQVKR